MEIILPEIEINQKEVRKQVIRDFVTSLNERNVYPIALNLQQNFIFQYGSKPAISNELTYIGYLFKTFHEMKIWRVKIYATMCYLDNENPSVLLPPPHDRRIVFPLEIGQEIELPDSKILLKCSFQNDKLFRIDVFLNEVDFKNRIVAYEGFPY